MARVLAPATWSEKVGGKGSCRVRVFERWPGGPIYAQWVLASGKKHTESLKTVGGKTIRDKALAVRIAKAISAKLEDEAVATVRAALGLRVKRTLEELLTELHGVRGPAWDSKYKKGQERHRDFWYLKLGKDCALENITAADVMSAATKAAKENAWSNRTHKSYLRYLVDAFLFGQNDLKWLGEDGNLSSVKFPKLDRNSKSYTEREILDLLDACPRVDLRVAAAAEIAFGTGRRINAIRQIETTDLVVEEIEVPGFGLIHMMVVTWRGESDKAGKTSRSPLPPTARLAVEALLETRVVQESGYLFPNRRDLSRLASTANEAKDIRPMREEDLIEMLHEAEQLAGVPTLKGRAFHGIKRRQVTVAVEEVQNLEIVAAQSGTTVEMLRSTYLQEDLATKAGLASKLEARRERKTASGGGRSLRAI
jgi:integrase